VFPRVGDRFALVRSASGPTHELLAVDGAGFFRPQTDFFVVSDGGQVEFVGRFDGGEPVAFRAPSEGVFAVVAVAADGAVGTCEGASFAGPGRVVVTVTGSGGLEFRPPAGQPDAVRATADGMVSFRPAAGPFAARTLWRTPRFSGAPRIDDVPAGPGELRFANGAALRVGIEPGAFVRVAMPAGTDLTRPR
jgi:hypothetical protein